MSETSSISLTLPGAKELARGHEDEALDLTVAHSFPFAGQRWFTGAGIAVQGLLMAGTGGFLLSQIPGTPNLAVQIAILGSLLIVCGVAFLARSLSDFFGYVRIDQESMRVRYGLVGYNIPWSRVKQWQVNETGAKSSLIGNVVLELSEPDAKRSILGGHLSLDAQHRVRRLLHAFAQGKEGTLVAA